MKSAGYLLLALAVLPASAQAFDFSLEPDRTRYLADPSYMPAKGELDGESTLGYSHTSEEHYTASGVLSPKYTANAATAAQSFTYGITNRINVSISETYLHRDMKDAYSNGTTYSFHTSGFEDPELSVRGRFIPQGKAPFYLDFVGGYSPDLFDAQTASTTSDGTAGRGSQAFEGAAIIGREMKSWTTQLALTSTYFGEGKSKVPGYANANQRDSYWDYSLQWKNGFRFTDAIFLNGGVTLGWHQDITATPANGPAYTSSQNMSTTVYLSPGYVLIPQKMTINAEFDVNNMGDSTETYSNRTEKWQNMQELYFGLHLRYKIL